MGKFVFCCFLACFCSTAIASYTLLSTLAEMVRDQTELEMKASIFYQTYGHYFENSSQALHGIANFFFKQSLEEKKHADKLMTYLNQRNVKINSFGEIQGFCFELSERDFCDFVVFSNSTSEMALTTQAFKAIKDAVDLEKKVYTTLEKIVTHKNSDPQLNHFIEHEYLDEQIESIKVLLDFKTQLKNIDTDYVGLLLFDRWLLDSKKTEL